MPTKMKARTTRKSRNSYHEACDLLRIDLFILHFIEHSRAQGVSADRLYELANHR